MGSPKAFSKVFTAAVYKAFYFHAARTEEFTTGVHSTICIRFQVVEKTIQRTARIWGF
jgi:hypothetical protein